MEVYEQIEFAVLIKIVNTKHFKQDTNYQGLQNSFRWFFHISKTGYETKLIYFNGNVVFLHEYRHNLAPADRNLNNVDESEMWASVAI